MMANVFIDDVIAKCWHRAALKIILLLNTHAKQWCQTVKMSHQIEVGVTDLLPLCFVVEICITNNWMTIGDHLLTISSSWYNPNRCKLMIRCRFSRWHAKALNTRWKNNFSPSMPFFKALAGQKDDPIWSEFQVKMCLLLKPFLKLFLFLNFLCLNVLLFESGK